MDETTFAMIAAGVGFVGTLVTWIFYYVAGKSLWDIRKTFRRTPGDHQ